MTSDELSATRNNHTGFSWNVTWYMYRSSYQIYSPQPDNMIHVAVLQVNMCAYPSCYDGTAEWLNSLRPDVTEWCIDVSLDKDIIGSVNGLVPARDQAIAWTNADFVLTVLMEMNLRKCLPNSWNKAIFFSASMS